MKRNRQGRLQVRQYACPALDVLGGRGDDFFAYATKFQIDAYIAHLQSADAEGLLTTRQQRPLRVRFQDAR